MNLLNCVQQGIVGLYPFYGEHGENETRIQLTTEAILVDCAISSILTQLADCYDKTLENIRRTAASVTGYSQYHPLYFSRSMIFIPIKHRKPYGRRDGSMAYINQLYIKDVAGTNDHPTIYFIAECPPYDFPLARLSTVRSKLVVSNTLVRYYDTLGG